MENKEKTNKIEVNEMNYAGIEKQYDRLKNAYLYAFAPAIFLLIAFMIISGIVILASATMFQIAGILATFMGMPLFVAFVVMGLVGCARSIKAHKEKRGFELSNEEHFLEKCLVELEMERRFISEETNKIEEKLRELRYKDNKKIE